MSVQSVIQAEQANTREEPQIEAAEFLHALKQWGTIERATLKLGLSVPTVHRYKREALNLVAGIQKAKGTGGRPPKFRLVTKANPVAMDTEPLAGEPAEALALLMFRHAGDKCIDDAGDSKWYLWLEGTHVYTRDTTKKAILSKKFVRNILQKAGRLPKQTNILDILDELKGLSETCELHKTALKNMDFRHIHSLIPFKNGVFCKDSNTFRPGLPSDRLSFAAAVAYVPWSNIDGTEKSNFLQWLAKILPSEPLHSEAVEAFANSLLANTTRLSSTRLGPRRNVASQHWSI